MIKNGSSVTLHLIGIVNEDEIFESTYEENDPITLIVGEGEHLELFENALIGMQKGDKKEIRIPCEDAYGLYDDNLVLEVTKEDFPNDISPELGMILEIPLDFDLDEDESESEAAIPMTVVEINDNTIVLDGNHELAGMDLIYQIEIINVENK